MSLIRSTAILAAGIITIGISTPVSIAQDSHSGHANMEKESSKPVNSMCPIGKEPVESDGGSTVYKGKTIGFCCKGCIKKFGAWDEAKKDDFVAMSMMKGQPDDHGDHDHGGKAMGDKAMGEHKEGEMGAKGGANERVGDPYPLSTCPISGEEFGGMGEPITKVYDGREVKFCCKMCVPKFEKDLKASFAKLDQQIIDSQLPFYPTTTCIVSGEPLGGIGEDGEPMGEPINFVYNNRLIRFCCKMCKGDFKKDPEAYIAKLDAAVIAQQSEHYPLGTCPISGEELGGEMGQSIDKVYAGRLIKFCCKKCVTKFEKNPAPTIEKLDAAWMAMHEGGNMDGDHNMDGGSMKDHDAKDGHGKSGHHDG
jgi:YHS domain-containing protein